MFNNIGNKLIVFNMMRKLWSIHVKLTRTVIIGIANDSPTLMNDIRELLKNQEDIGNGIREKFGDNAANTLTALLKDHINIAGELLKAAKTNNTKSVEYQKSLWFNNADQISKFLSGLNNSWSYDKIKNILYDHLNLTLKEGVAQFKGNTNESVNWYNKALYQIVSMADVLTMGVLNQVALHGYHIASLITSM